MLEQITDSSVSPLPNLLTSDDWAEAELGSIALNDARLRRRLVYSFACMLSAPGQSIPQCTGSLAAARACYRLLDDERLTDTLILDTHRVSVLKRAQQSGAQVFLAIQDTTTLNLDTHKSLTGLGSIGANNVKASTAGLFVHSTLFTAADQDQVFGLLGAKIYARESSSTSPLAPGARNRQPISEKESIRWLESFELTRKAQQALAQLTATENPLAPPPLVINVGDREADIYELLTEAQAHRDEGMGLLVRAQHNRSLGDETGTSLWERLAESDSQGTVSLNLPRSQGRKARTVELNVRFVAVTIAVPGHKQKYLKMTTPVQINLIELREVGVEEGICWRLLTTLPVGNLIQAVQISRWYAKRWQIEEFHRVLKTGCRLEARQLRTLERLKPAIALDMIVACSLMGMRAAARETPAQPAQDWLAPAEIAALVAYHREEQPVEQLGGLKDAVLTIGQAVKWISRLGGHLGRKGDGPPGVEVIWRGLIKLEAITEAWRRFNVRDTCG